MSDFSGFPQSGLSFLRQLPKRDKAWFQANRKIYDEALATPAKAFVELMGDRLRQSISTKLIAVPRANGSIAPINNDVRFSKDKSPYKDHLLFRFWEGETKKTAPTLFIRLSAEEAGFASGVMFADIDRWRLLIDDDATGKPLAGLIKNLAKGRTLDVAGQELKRVPAPYPADHHRADLLRHKMFQVRWAETLPGSVNSAKFADWCTQQLEKLADIHCWLVQNL